MENIIKFPGKTNNNISQIPNRDSQLPNNTLVGDAIDNNTINFFKDKITTNFLPIVSKASYAIKTKTTFKSLQEVAINFKNLSPLQKTLIKQLLTPLFSKGEDEWYNIKKSFNEYVFNEDEDEDGDAFDVVIATALDDEVDAFWHLKNLLN